MTDRRALLIGSWKAAGKTKPSQQKVSSILSRMVGILDDRYGYRSLADPSVGPQSFSNPKPAEIMGHVYGPSDITPDTELLVYFVGHAIPVGNDDIQLILTTENDENLKLSLSDLVRAALQGAGVKKLILVVDGCHAGRARIATVINGDNVFAMFGAEDHYAFDASFSESFLRALEHPLGKHDERIDRKAGGMTWLRVFEYARQRVMTSSTSGEQVQVPISAGSYVGALLREAPKLIPKRFHPYASDRSVYGRVYRILGIINDRSPDLTALLGLVRNDRIFLLRSEEKGRGSYLSQERLREYLEFLRKVGWIVEPQGRFRTTQAGKNACDYESFNENLLQAIETNILEGDVNIDLIEEIVKELMENMIPPTPIQIQRRAAGSKGRIIKLDGGTRLALQLLPSTGRFMRGTADAIFPPEFHED